MLVGKYLGPKTSLELSADSSLDRLEATFLSCTFISLYCYPSDTAVTTTTYDHLALSAQHVRRFRGLTYSLSGRVTQTAGRQEVDLHPLPTTPPPVPIGPIAGVFISPLSTLSLGRYHEYAVGAELFPTAKISVRIGYSTFDGVTPYDYGYDIGASWFITHHVALRFGFDRLETAYVLPAVDTATVQVIGRF